MRFTLGTAACCLSAGAALLKAGDGGAAAFLAPLIPARAASSSPSAGAQAQTAWCGSRAHDVVAVGSSRMSTAARAAPAVSGEALGLQEQLRKLCADESEPDREARIEALAKVCASFAPKTYYTRYHICSLRMFHLINFRLEVESRVMYRRVTRLYCKDLRSRETIQH